MVRRALVALALLVAFVLVVSSSPIRPFWLERTGLRVRMASELTHALRRPVTIATLDVGLLPPRLSLGDVAVGGGVADARPRFTAGRFDLRFGLRDLLARRVEPVRIDFDRAKVVVDGPPTLVLSIAHGTLASADDPAPSGDGTDAAFGWTFAASFDDEGRVEASGTIDPAGDASLDATLDRVTLAPFSAWLGVDSSDGARVGGRLAVDGSLVSPRRIEAALRLQEGTIALRDLTLRGDVRATIEASDDWIAPNGRLQIDASAGVLERGTLLRKAAGAGARFDAKFGLRPDGRPGLVEPRLRLDRVEMRAIPGAPGGVRLELGVP